MTLFQPSTATDASIAGASKKREENGRNQVTFHHLHYNLTIEILITIITITIIIKVIVIIMIEMISTKDPGLHSSSSSLANKAEIRAVEGGPKILARSLIRTS